MSFISILRKRNLNLKLNEILKDLNLRQVQRWAIFSIIIGIVSGFGAILFYMGFSTVSDYVLGGIGGYNSASFHNFPFPHD